MKNIALMLLICNVANSQPIGFIEVIHVDSASGSQLFDRARQWFNTAFKDSGEVLNIQDKESGELAGKGVLKYNSRIFSGSNATTGWVSFTVQVLVKDGRYRYDITNFIHEGNILNRYGPANFGLITQDTNCPYTKRQVWPKSPSLGGMEGWMDKVWIDIKEQINAETASIIGSLKEYMGRPISKSDDW